MKKWNKALAAVLSFAMVAGMMAGCGKKTDAPVDQTGNDTVATDGNEGSEGAGVVAPVAEVPEGEMADFSTAMRQITQGRGSFTTEFARYDRAPENIAQKVIADAAEE